MAKVAGLVSSSPTGDTWWYNSMIDWGVMDYCWFVLGNGRGRFLDRTIASWEANLIDTPKHKIIFDDSGNSEYREWLQNKFGNRFVVVPISEHAVGQPAAINFIFNYLSGLDVDYFLEIEEDWMLNRPINISEIASKISTMNDVCQIRIPRAVWHETNTHYLDLQHGTLLNYYLSNYTYSKQDNLYEIESDSYFWSHNPNIFSRHILNHKYPQQGIESEYLFGKLLFESSYRAFAYWATNPYESYVSHIGYHEKYLGNALPEIVNL